MRKKRLFYNTATSLVSQIVAVISGLILPGLILRHYGSETNGLIQSITQFLAVISFLDMGVGRVIETSLYEPLTYHDNRKVSEIITSAARFFRRLGCILAVYVVVLSVVYPLVIQQSFDFWFAFYLIIILSVNSFIDYFFIQTDSRLLNADQRQYVLNTVRIISQIGTVVISTIMIRLNCSVHAMKLTLAAVCLWRPVFLRLYVRKHYCINRKIKYEGEPIRDKWYGLAQHIEYIILINTDHVILTLCSTLQNVSVYSVYHMILAGIGKIVDAIKNGFLSLLGELWTRKEEEELRKTFVWFEWITHTLTVFLFGCASVLIIPFILVYTEDVTDADYIQPLFSAILTAAGAVNCFRSPYNMMILASGHYKETQNCYVITAALNLGISILAVWQFGLVGVAAGTLIALGYQMIWMAKYTEKYLVQTKGFFKRILTDIGMTVVGIVLTWWLPLGDVSYLGWIMLALKVALIWTAVVLIANLVCYPDMMRMLMKKLRKTWTLGNG